MLARILLAVVAGTALALSFEPLAWRWLAPLGVAGLVLAVLRLPPRRAWLPGLLFGLAFMGVLQWWMLAIGTDAYVGITLVEAAFFAPLGVAVTLVGRLRWWPLWVAAAWVAVEVVRGQWPFSGMPWGRLGYGVADTPMAQALPYLGFTGVSFVVALGGAVLAWLVAGGWRRPLTAVGAALVPVLLVSVPVLAPYQPEQTGSATVAVVQGDVPGDGSDVLYDHRRVTRNHVDATVELAEDVEAGARPEPDLVVWPENSTAVDPFLDAGINAGITEAVQAIGVPVLVGAVAETRDGEDILNQGIVWRPGTGAGDRYTKRHPVPFGEYIPWRETLLRDFQNFGQLRLISRDMLSGTRPDPLRAGDLRVADAICFDIAYDDGLHDQLRRGAEVVVVQTSNAMFIHTGQIGQQFEITRLRALESGRAVAVAAVNGLTGVVRPDGSVQAAAEPRTRTSLVAEVPLSDSVTPAVLMGPWPGRVLAVVAAAAVLLSLGRGGVAGRNGSRPADRQAEDDAVLVPAGAGGPRQGDGGPS